MGRLTDDMTRLCSELGALHSTREAFITDLKRDVSETLSGFRKNHTEMARRTKDDLGAFVSGLKANVSGMLSDFRNDFAERARKTRDDLATFVRDLGQKVGSLREESAADLAGARQAWFGRSPAPAKRRAPEGSSKLADVKKWVKPAKANEEEKES